MLISQNEKKHQLYNIIILLLLNNIQIVIKFKISA